MPIGPTATPDFFVFTILGETASGRAVLDAGRALAAEPQGALEQLISPLLEDEDPETCELFESYERDFGVLEQARTTAVADDMRVETDALQRLCANIERYSYYKRIRYYVIGLLAWLMSYMLKTASP